MVNPIKLREYLAAGLAVVSTPMPEVIGYSPFVLVAENVEEFAAAIRTTLDDEPDRYEVAASVKNEGWDSRYRILRQKIECVRGQE